MLQASLNYSRRYPKNSRSLTTFSCLTNTVMLCRELLPRGMPAGLDRGVGKGAGPVGRRYLEVVRGGEGLARRGGRDLLS
jgi:hypothetical protein